MRFTQTSASHNRHQDIWASVRGQNRSLALQFVFWICFAIEVPSIGNIIRYSGALCGAVVLFVLPSLVFLADAKREGRLTVWNVSLHVFIMALGLINFGAQFFI